MYATAVPSASIGVCRQTKKQLFLPTKFTASLHADVWSLHLNSLGLEGLEEIRDAGGPIRRLWRPRATGLSFLATEFKPDITCG